MDKRTKTALALVGVGGLAASLGVYFWRRSRRYTLAHCKAPHGRAAIFTLEGVDRHDHPGGKFGGPGQPAGHYLTVASKPILEIEFAELFAPDSPFVLYSIEQTAAENPFMVFLELPAAARNKMWKDEPFVDRGIRKLVELGSRVAITSLASAEAFAASTCAKFASGEWALSFVWNTGRCGSTLMHKAISAKGVVSISEPHWFDQLQFDRSLSQPSLQRALRTCVALEFMTAKLQKGIPGWAQATRLSFNPKSGGLAVAEAATSLFPFARHAFMYRACHKVVESFAGLMFADGLPLPLKILWATMGVKALPAEIKDGEDLPLNRLSSLIAAVMTRGWIATIKGWVQMCERRAKDAVDGMEDPLCAAPVIRMDEFTSKDIQVRTAVLRTALIHFGVIEANDGDDAMRPALEVFAVNSQEGSKMAGPKARIISPNDVHIIKDCVAISMATLTGVVVQDKGANVILPGSLGVAGLRA